MGIRNLQLRLFLCAAAGFALGCGSEDDPSGTTGSDGSLSIEKAACYPELKTFITELHKAKACVDASECMHAAAKAPLWEDDLLGFYLSSNGDLGKVQATGEVYGKCVNEMLHGSSRLPTQGVCWRNKCWAPPSGPDQGSCFADAPTQDECAECYCGSPSANAKECWNDPLCVEYYECARQESCLGSLQCADPSSPCAKILAKATGNRRLLLQGIDRDIKQLGCGPLCVASK